MRMHKVLYLIGMMVFILAIATPGAAQDGPTAPNWPDDGMLHLFLPGVIQQYFPFQLTGQIKDAQDFPLSGASVVSDMGRMSVTDANGVYQMTTGAGSQKVSVSKAGYNFEPASADLNISSDMNNLNFTAVSTGEASIAGCTNMLLNSNFEGAGGWTISPAKNPSAPTSTAWFTPVTSMLSGVPVGSVNPFPGEFTTGEFWQSTGVAIPADAYIVNLRMHLLPRSSSYWGYHLAEQAVMDANKDLNAPDATEAQYGHIRDSANTTTLRQLFKWFPIDSYYWLYRSYDLRDFRGSTISVLFGAANNGYGGNTALYVDDVYLYYCTP